MQLGVPLKSTEAVQMAEDLLAVFHCVGVPIGKSLSSLQSKVYKILHTKKIRAGPRWPSRVV